MAAKEDQISKVFKETSDAFFAERTEYDSIHTLMLYWRQTDLQLPGTEVPMLRSLLEEDYKFQVTTFPIPSDGSQHLVHTELSAFVSRWSGRLRSLIIIYYAGHGAEGPDGDALMKAFRDSDDPQLSWKSCQGILFGAVGDVLLILDCCHAALASRASKFRKKHGRFEVLAAASKGCTTPGPGVTSFTAFLYRALKKHKTTGITARELGDKLWEEERIKETPRWGDMVHNIVTSIRLQPFKVPLERNYIRRPSGYLLFRASLSDDLTGLQIADWLKTAPPKSVTAVNIEAVVLTARLLQRSLDGDAFPPDSIFRKLPQSEQERILQQLQGVNTIMSTSEADSKVQSNPKTISRSYESIDKSVDAASREIETSVLCSLKEDDMMKASTDKTVVAVNADESISLRRFFLQQAIISDELELPRETIDIAHSDDRFALGEIDQQTVLVEYFEYDPNGATGRPYKDTLNQLQKMTSLLCHSKRLSFHILPGVGFTHDPLKHRFGLVFEYPMDHDVQKMPVKLIDLFKQRDTALVPLGHRIKLAHSLAVALENFHRVGWIHKHIQSENITFLRRSSSEGSASNPHEGAIVPARDVDLAAPWLFGFEYARATDAGTKLEADFLLTNNVYRHPDRWNMPEKEFTKHHDVYSLGVVLFEIAAWKDIYSYVFSGGITGKRVLEDHVLKYITKSCQKILPHQVGQVFTDTIMTCLNFETQTMDLNDYETQKYFQTEIRDRLYEAVGKI